MKITVLTISGITALAVLSSSFAAPDTVTVGAIKVAAREQALLIPVSTAIDSGILEYLAVTKGGKTYESVLAADCDAKDLHAALLLINAKPGGVTVKEDSTRTMVVSGDTMLCDVVYRDAKGKTGTMPASDLFRHCNPAKRAEGEALKKGTPWLFIGSHEVDLDGKGKKVLASAMEGSLISIIIDPSVEISLGQSTDNPYRGEQQGFCVDEKRIKTLPKTFLLKITRKKK
ncbi:MAG: hypothetical protein JXA71_18905 [Chitinispirillaceae bacterium]|nr:hypothetical protein [Chitinispirillaceae bacterium]